MVRQAARLALLAMMASTGMSGAGLAQDAPPGPATVWVNLSSKVYHCPGAQYYGRTKRGEYLTEPEARARGYRPNGGRLCFPESAGQTATRPLGPRGAPGSGLYPGAGPVAPLSFGPDCLLTRITDGDTLECRDLGPVRLIGIDSPEGDQEPFGTAATAALASLVPVGSALRLELDQEARDRYGRLLAYVWLDGEMVNWAMVRLGWAVSFRYAPNIRYAERLEAAEQQAEGEGRGLWAVRGFDCRPADRRRKAC